MRVTHHTKIEKKSLKEKMKSNYKGEWKNLEMKSGRQNQADIHTAGKPFLFTF